MTLPSVVERSNEMSLETLPRREERRGFIYFLVAGENVLYVGQTIQVELRIVRHLTVGEIPFNRVFWIEVSYSDLDLVEGALIRSLWPPHNRRAPKYAGRDNEALAMVGAAQHIDERTNARAWMREMRTRPERIELRATMKRAAEETKRMQKRWARKRAQEARS